MDINERGKVIIIPDENKILRDKYEKNITKNHLEAYQDFSSNFHLGYIFRDEDYTIAPLKVALEGHLSVKTEETVRMIIIYIPRVVTDRQMEWFFKNMDKFNDYQMIGAYSIEKDHVDEIEDFEEIKNTMNRKNMLYDRKEEDEDVREKIQS